MTDNSAIPTPLDLATMSRSRLRQLCTRVGGTPLVPLELRLPGGHRLFLKLEGENPGGSSKDRPALRIIEDLEATGQLSAGCVIADSTSGNFGVSMAWICRARGYQFHAVSDPNATVENVQRMRALGAVVEIVDQRDEVGGYLLTRLRRVDELVRIGVADLSSNQYENPANPASHHATTGPELVRQLDQPPDAVFICASTGGTLGGISRYLRQSWPSTMIIAVDGEGSSLFGGTPGPRLINGLGSSRPSPFVSQTDYDEVIRVDASVAISYCRELAHRHGFWVGGSSGAVIAAAVSRLRSAGRPQSVVCLCPDHGGLYLNSIFRDEWARSRGGLITVAQLADHR